MTQDDVANTYQVLKLETTAEVLLDTVFVWTQMGDIQLMTQAGRPDQRNKILPSIAEDCSYIICASVACKLDLQEQAEDFGSDQTTVMQFETHQT